VAAAARRAIESSGQQCQQPARFEVACGNQRDTLKMPPGLSVLRNTRQASIVYAFSET
jgi:hypothetical protein